MAEWIPDDGTPITAKQRRSLAQPIGNLLGWRAVDRCLLIAFILLPGGVLFFGIEHLAHGWFYSSTYMGDQLLDLITVLSAVHVAVWALVIVAGVLLRTRAPESRFFVYLTVQLYSLDIAIFVCVTGSFHSPGWILFLGGGVLGFLLFGRLPTLLGLTTFIVVVVASIVATQHGFATELAMATRPPPVDADAWSWWIWRMGISTAVYGTLTLALCAYVIAQLRDREARLEVLSKTDALTGVTNRRHFMEVVGRELARAGRYETPISCVMIDLDHFKRVNDEHGHLVGDRVLVAVTDAIGRSVRESDYVARYGGEEFVILLPATDVDGARELAERCRSTVATTQVADRAGPLSVTASMGISSFEKGNIGTVDELLSAADQALYEAKKLGRNRVVVADSD